MKLFQQLLVAPAALGLLASGANAAELNINGVSDYAASAEQVTSVTQFSDVYPTDWAYQALSNLVEQYGCVAGYPNGTFRGNRAMTRYEAAALLNACLDRVTEVTDELRRLIAEFETELAVLADALTASKLALANWKQPSSPPPPNSRVKAHLFLEQRKQSAIIQKQKLKEIEIIYLRMLRQLMG
jgi:hypothetical protein